MSVVVRGLFFCGRDATKCSYVSRHALPVHSSMLRYMSQVVRSSHLQTHPPIARDNPFARRGLLKLLHSCQYSSYRCHARLLSNMENLCISKRKELSPMTPYNFHRHSHTETKFTLKDKVFANYVTSLVQEYSALCEEMNTGKGDDAQTLRFQFLRPVVIVVEKLQSKMDEVAELAKLLEEEEDTEMKTLMKKEMEDFEDEIRNIEEELVEALVGQELADNNDIALEVSAGVGGQEAMLFTAEVFNMYCNYAFYKGWTVGRVFQDEAELGGARKAYVDISGEDVYRHLKHEAGVHRVQRVPKTEKQGRMHTSTITVSVIPQPREIDIEIDPKDLKIETMRGSGPGGQSVNTTDSVVRVTHIPTGTVSESRQERSQIKNKEIALNKLKMRMFQARMDDQEAKRKAARKMQVGTRGRSEKIRTYNFQQDRISDHRVKGNVNNIQDFMQGGEGLDDLVASLEEEEKHSALASMVEEFEESLKKKKGKS